MTQWIDQTTDPPVPTSYSSFTSVCCTRVSTTSSCTWQLLFEQEILKNLQAVDSLSNPPPPPPLFSRKKGLLKQKNI